MAISQSIKRACRRYEDVKVDGLTLYPILVEEMETFEIARPGIDIVQQSLPVAPWNAERNLWGCFRGHF